MKGVYEVPPPLSGAKYRYFVKPRKALAMSGKEIPEARFCILRKHVQEVCGLSCHRRSLKTLFACNALLVTTLAQHRILFTCMLSRSFA
jgi:hypothetical protein